MKLKQTGMAAPDPAEDVEQTLRKMTTGNCKAMLAKLVHNIEKIPNTARVLRLIEVVANLHRQALANFGTGTAPVKRNGLYVSNGGLSYNALSDSDGLGDTEGNVLQGSVPLGNTGETFAAQLATQFLSGIKQTQTPQGISHLVSALAEAKEAGLTDVEASIKAKLEALLATGPNPALPASPEPEKKNGKGKKKAQEAQA